MVKPQTPDLKPQTSRHARGRRGPSSSPYWWTVSSMTWTKKSRASWKWHSKYLEP